MSFEVVAEGVTFCPDTPANWAEFHRLKRAICGGDLASKPVRLRSRQEQEAVENKRLGQLRTFLPGREPDR